MHRNRKFRNVLILLCFLTVAVVNGQDCKKQIYTNRENNQVLKVDILNASNQLLLSTAFDFVEGFADTVKGIEYYEDGFKVRYDLISPFANMKSFYKYDDNDNIIKSLTIAEKSTDSIFVFFDNFYSGILLDSTHAKATSDSITMKIINKYDSDGKLIESSENSKFGNKLSKYQYNEKDSLVLKVESELNKINTISKETQSEFKNGILTYKRIMQNGSLIEEIDYKYVNGELFEIETHNHNTGKISNVKIVVEKVTYTPRAYDKASW